MMQQTDQPARSPWKNPFLYTGAAILFAACYTGFIMYSRWDSNRQYDRQKAEREAQQRQANDRKVLEQWGGNELVIQGLYVSPPRIHAGDTARLCYDVNNAKTVTLDPPAGAVWPSHSRCLDISPRKTTTYTLTIADATGKSLSQDVTLRVE